MNEVTKEGYSAIEQALRDEVIPPRVEPKRFERRDTIAHSPPVAPAASSIDDVLTARNGVHGDFDDDASTSQDLKRIIRAGTNWALLPAVHREALEQMMTKVGRILAGDFNHVDHWQDLQGYPRLVEKWIAANIK